MKIFTYEVRKGLITDNLANNIQTVFKKAGINYNIETEPVDNNLKIKLDKWNDSTDLYSLLLIELSNKDANFRVLIATDKNSQFYKWCKSKCPQAEWGCSNKLYAIDYAPMKMRESSQLHECLHLFQVDDCYDEKTLKPKSNCKNENCVMRYGNDKLDVCSNVLAQLKRYYKKLDNS